MAILDVLRISLVTLLSMLFSPGRLPQRRWLTEFISRLLRKLLDESKTKPITWLRQRQELMTLRSPAEKSVDFESVILAGVPCLWCRPKGSKEPRHILVYFHGGGYVIGSVSSYRGTLAALAESGDAHVLAVDYRLGPEYRYPTAQRDCFGVSRQLFESYPHAQVLLGGDSAGGALAVATSISLAKDESVRAPAALVLLSPWVDPGSSTGSILDNAKSDVLDLSLIQGWLTLYLKGGRASCDVKELNEFPGLSFSEVDFSSLPRIYVQAAGAEIFIDQIVAFVERAKDQGVEVSLDVFDDQFHVFQTLSPLAPGAKEALDKIGGYIKTVPVSSV